MSISKKRAPVVQDSQLSRVLNQIYDDLNEVINSVNQGASTEVKKSEAGKSGDLRIVKGSNGEYFMEAKTDEGWVQSNNVSSSGFKFKEKE